jgi:hypothetical protein
MITQYNKEDYYIDTIDLNKSNKIESLQLRKVNDFNIKIRVLRKQIELNPDEEKDLIEISIL